MKPTLFKIGNFELRIYSLMYILAFIIGIKIAEKDDVAKKRGIKDKKMIEDFAFFAMISGLIGARAYYVIMKFNEYASNPISILKVWEGGLAIHGGIIGGLIGSYLYAKKHKINLWTLTDMGVGPLLFGQFLGRFGNLANGEIHGVPTFTPLNVILFGKFKEWWTAYQSMSLDAQSKFKELLQDITDNDYFLPTKREWEYLAGKGCRTIFPWGNNMDFSMKLRHIEFMDDDEEYSLEKENFFGLYIADDPYCREIVYDDGVFSYKGGDGGRNICGGMGPVWGYFPVSLYFEEKDEEIGEYINGGYDFFRRVIRIMKR